MEKPTLMVGRATIEPAELARPKMLPRAKVLRVGHEFILAEQARELPGRDRSANLFSAVVLVLLGASALLEVVPTIVVALGLVVEVAQRVFRWSLVRDLRYAVKNAPRVTMTLLGVMDEVNHSVQELRELGRHGGIRALTVGAELVVEEFDDLVAREAALLGRDLAPGLMWSKWEGLMGEALDLSGEVSAVLLHARRVVHLEVSEDTLPSSTRAHLRQLGEHLDMVASASRAG